MENSTKRTISEVLEITAAVCPSPTTSEASTESNGSKRSRKLFIDKKKEFILTYANTFGILTKDMVKEMLEKYGKFFYIISLEKCHNTDDHEHIHVYVKCKRGALSTRDIRFFDVTNNGFTNETKSAHPNIKYKNDFGSSARGSIRMMEYVIKEDTNPLSNFDYISKINELKNTTARHERNTGPDPNIIPFFDWVRETPLPTQDEVRKRIRENREYYQVYVALFLNINGVIKHEFPFTIPPAVLPNFEFEYFIPLKLYHWIMYFERWVAERFDRPKGLWITGLSKTGKTSLCASFGPYNYFPNIWDMGNFQTGKWYNLFDDQDIIFDSPESFRYFKPFIGAQQVMTLTDKYKAKKTVVNGIPCIWCSNLKFEEQVTDVATRDYIRKNMVIVELGQYDLFKKNCPPSHTLTYLQWTDYYPKANYYYLHYVQDLLPPEEVTSEANTPTRDSSLIVEPSTSLTPPNPPTPLIISIDSDEDTYVNGSSE